MGTEPTRQSGACDSVHDIACAATESMLSIMRQFDDCQQGVDLWENGPGRSADTEKTLCI
jgi:hypothetical protein